MAEHTYTELSPDEIEATLKNRRGALERDLLAQEVNLIGVSADADRAPIEKRIDELKAAIGEIDEKHKRQVKR